MTGSKKTIKIPSRLSLDQAFKVVSEFTDAVVRQKADTVELDFSSVTKLYPNGIVPLIIQNDCLRQKYEYFVHLLPPSNGQLKTLCNVSNWFYYLDEGNQEWRKNSWQTAKSFPLLRFGSETEVNELVRKAVEITSLQAEFGTGVKRVFEWALNEVVGNVLDHSGKEYGWMQVTTFTDNKEIHIIVGDAGLGIPKTMSAVYGGYDDSGKILKALERGVTRDKAVGQGNGLAGTLSIVEHCGGRLHIWSHKGYVFTQPQHGVQAENVSAWLDGTVVEFSIRFDTEVDFGSVLWGHQPLHQDEFRYEDEMGNIAVNLADLDTNFGNRPTGERIRNYLLNLLKESPASSIVVHMKGITVISSSFADELFGKLVGQIGFIAFNQKIKFGDIDPVCKQIIEKAVIQRLTTNNR